MGLAKQSALLRHELLERIHDARERSDELFRLVSPGAIYERPIPERHRLVFYVGHLEAFDWNLLSERVLSERSLRPEFDRLFAFGIDPVGGGLPTDQPSDWPQFGEVQAYVRQVRSVVERTLDRILAPGVRPHPDLNTLLNVAIEHRLMHVETLAYMLHQLPCEKKNGQNGTPQLVTSPVASEMIKVPAGAVSLGLSRESGKFGWDNEFEAFRVNVPTFEIDQFMVSNAQWLDFIKAGGYEAPEFWSAPDWEWKSSKLISHPVFWKKSGERWRYRAMFGEIPLPLDWPVYVSHAEAAAYARWAGKSLPTEAEWQRAAYGTEEGGERAYPWGENPASGRLCNADFASWDPIAVNALPAGASAFGVGGMVGNGWEWTSTPFAPFQGFEPFSFYRGYSADFFDGKHFVMKGGSTRTAACMLRSTFRNWFQSHYQYVYAGFRCVRH
ncbi:MAG TPA: SUMF1/EgtB/PvdO family nonheme iron enzyme [Terriglobales bacterium]|jgi:ergothioneine biosynthesis protein EgtB|nr:SUMF1/EgtB/PvdO family nonheme iron enzyme [Terriglobales bacterium]